MTKINNYTHAGNISELELINSMKNRFNEINGNKDTVICPIELTLNLGVNQYFIEKLDALMYASIDQGIEGHFGLSKQDLFKIEKDLKEGKTIATIAEDLKRQHTPENQDFYTFVQNNRRTILDEYWATASQSPSTFPEKEEQKVVWNEMVYAERYGRPVDMSQ